MNIPSGLLRYGSNGNTVKDLQRELNSAGFNCGAVDGIFGSHTRAAVLAFQRARHIGVDGIVGRQTWTTLGGDRFEGHSGSGGRPSGSGGTHGTKGVGSSGGPGLSKAVQIGMEAVRMEQSSHCYDYTQAYGGRTNYGRGPLGTHNGRATFDCSGFVGAVYKAAGLPPPYTVGYEGTSYDVANCQNMQKVSESQARPGDVVVFPGHISLYIGNGQAISMGAQGDPKVLSVASEAAYENRGIVGFFHPKGA